MGADNLTVIGLVVASMAIVLAIPLNMAANLLTPKFQTYWARRTKAGRSREALRLHRLLEELSKPLEPLVLVSSLIERVLLILLVLAFGVAGAGIFDLMLSGDLPVFGMPRESIVLARKWILVLSGIVAVELAGLALRRCHRARPASVRKLKSRLQSDLRRLTEERAADRSAVGVSGVPAVDVRRPRNVTGPTAAGSVVRHETLWMVILPYRGSSYCYRVLQSGTVPEQVGTPGFADPDWMTGDAAFGGVEGGSPASPQTNVGNWDLKSTIKTFWPPNTEIVLRKELDIGVPPAGARLSAAVDNDIVAAYLNGTELPNSSYRHEERPHPDDLQCDVPVSLLWLGSNLLVVHARDRGGETYLDVKFEVLLPAPAGSTPT